MNKQEIIEEYFKEHKLFSETYKTACKEILERYDQLSDNKVTEGYWWCPECKEEVDSIRVTHQELHDTCGRHVEWKEPLEQSDNKGEVSDEEIEKKVESMRIKYAQDNKVLVNAHIIGFWECVEWMRDKRFKNQTPEGVRPKITATDIMQAAMKAVEDRPGGYPVTDHMSGFHKGARWAIKELTGVELPPQTKI